MATIRPAAPADAPAMVALRATVFPYLVRGLGATVRMIERPSPEESRADFVATDGDRVVGAVAVVRNVRAAAPDVGQINTLHVHPDHRHRGIGDALFGAAVGHLRSIGVRRVGTIVNPESVGYARRHGFEPKREIRYSALDLARLPAAAPTGPEVALVPIGEVDEQALYDADAAAATDEPTDLPQVPVPFATWQYEFWDDDLDRRDSIAAVRDGRVLAFTLLSRDGERLWSDMTATRREVRGQGLARLVKWTSLTRAAATGATIAYTANDESNRPMLAVNEQLGYLPSVVRFSCVTILES